MQSAQGHYSIIQYCPDPSRAEAANVGIVLFSAELYRMEFRLVDDMNRLRRFFGIEDANFIAIQREALEERLRLSKTSLYRIEEFNDFATRRAQSFRFTQPRSVKIVDFERELDELFKKLIAPPVARTSDRSPLKQRLKSLFENAGVMQDLATSIALTIPSLQREVRVPYGYRNGRFNLIEPVSFSSQNAFAAACTRAVEGEEIFQFLHPQYGPMRLIVVGDFGSASGTEQTIREVLKKHQVGLYPFSNVEPLIEDIKRHSRTMAH